MSQTKTKSASKGTTTRKNINTLATSGSGACKRLYIGHNGSYQYAGYLQFTLDSTFWLNVGKIVSAVLTLYTDDGLGVLGAVVSATDHPAVILRRLTSAFSEGSNSADFASADWTSPSNTTSGAFSKTVSAGVLEAAQIDITAFVEAWAPSTVKTRTGAAGGKATNYGLALLGSTDVTKNWAVVSEDSESSLTAFRPVLTLTYEYGLTTPDAPSNLTPVGAVASIGSFQGDFTDIKTTDTLRYSEVEVYTPAQNGTAAITDVVSIAAHGFQNGDVIYFTSLTGGTGLSTFTKYYVRDRTAANFKVAATSGGAAVDITVAYTAVTAAKRIYDVRQAESDTAILNARFDHVPSNLHLTRNLSYRFRARVTDQEGQTSAYSALTTFSVTNTDPNAPVLSPASGATYASLDGVQFSAPFTDPDAGDTLLAFQVEMSAYAEGNANWDDPASILWETGKRYVVGGSTSWTTPYGGASLVAGTYYWRARHWDQQQGVSSWAYAQIVLTDDFVVDAQDSTNAIQLRPRAPWRILIKSMGANRGPGDVVAVLEDATNVGASLLYNSPGEVHWTLSPAHPQLAVIEPKQTHYAIEFRQGDGWREVFQGLVDDFDATEQGIIFYGKDYLALLDSSVDEHYDPANPELPAEKGGSKYVTTGKNSIGYIVSDQLKRAREVANSPVGFITSAQSSATLAALLTETITVYSTYQPTLRFIVGLLDSHRAGTGKRTRLSVQKTAAGAYQWRVQDNPGTVRDNLRLRYGELVQGYRVVPFGPNWATRVSGIGRDKDGVLVRYKSLTAPGFDESVWGRWVQPQFFDGISDANDFERKVKQAAVTASKLGKQMGVGLRSAVLQPRDGYDVCDIFPVDIEHGAVSTEQFGSGYWVAVGITWTALERGDLNTILTLLPREDSVAPSSDLLVLQPISRQAEWQIGWSDPNPLNASSKFWLDQTTGTVYVRTDGVLIADPITGTK